MKFDTIQVFSLSYLWSLYVCMSSCFPSSLSFHWSTMLLPHQSHNSCIFSSFCQSEFSNVFSNCLPKQMHSHIGCIWMTCFQSEFSNVFSNRLSEQMQSRIGCIWMFFFPELVFKCLFKSSEWRDAKSHRLNLNDFSPERRIGCIWTTFFQSEISNVFSNCLQKQMHSRIGRISMTCFQCEFSNIFSNCLSEQMHSRIGCISPEWNFKCLLKLSECTDA